MYFRISKKEHTKVTDFIPYSKVILVSSYLPGQEVQCHLWNMGSSIILLTRPHHLTILWV